MASAPAAEPAASPVKSAVAVTTDRIWRGLSDTRGRAGIVGEVKWQTPNGPLAGLWVASAGDERYDTSVHILPFVGYTITRSGVNVELAYLRHIRPVPEPDDLDFGEFNASIGAGAGRFSARLGLFYNPDCYRGGSSSYEYLTVAMRLPRVATLDTGVFVQAGASQFTVETLRDYTDWKLGFRASGGRWYGSAALSGTMSSQPPSAGLVGRGDAGTRFSVTLGRSF